MSTLDLIQPLVDISYGVKALVYGDPGVGKTVFGCNSPMPLLLDVDGTGATSLLNHPEINANTKVLQVRQFNQMLDVFEEFKKKEMGLPCHPVVHDRETLVVDTLSALAQKHLEEFIAKEKIGSPQRDPVAYQRDYKFNTAAMRQLVGYFTSLEMNVVMLAHADLQKDERTGIIKVKPMLTPKLASAMEAVFDIFAFMTSETDDQFNTQRVLQIMPTRTVVAKTRIGGLPSLIAEPAFQHFVDRKAILVNENRALVAARQAAELAAQEQLQQHAQAIEVEHTQIQPEVQQAITEQAVEVPAFVGATFTLDAGPVKGTETPSEETT